MSKLCPITTRKREIKQRTELFEIESATNLYAKNETPIESGFVNVNKHLMNNKFLAGPFDKGNGFGVIEKESYEQKLLDVLNSPQFKEEESNNDEITVKVENEMNSTFLEMRKPELIKKRIYYKLKIRTGGNQ